MYKLIFHFLIIFLAFGIIACESSEGDRMYETAVDYWKKGNYDEALQNLIALTKSYPNHSLVDDALYITAGIYQYYLDEPKNAIRFYRILNKNFTQSEYYTDSMINLAEIYEKGSADDMEKAINIYKTLEQLPDFKDSEIPLYRLARAYLGLGNNDEARQYLKKLILTFPDSDYAIQGYLMIGYSYYSQGMAKIAHLTFSEAVKRYKNSNRAVDLVIALANIYEEWNQLENAIQTYGDAREKVSVNDSLHSVLSNRIDILKDRLKSIKK